MESPLLIRDQEGVCDNSATNILLWKSYIEKKGLFSLPKYLEENSEEFRARYLSFIADVGESKIDDQTLTQDLNIGDEISYWWMSTIAEKSPFKTHSIYQCLLIIALEEFLIEFDVKEVVFESKNPNLNEAVESLCFDLDIEFSSRLFGVNRQLLNRVFNPLPAEINGLLTFLKRAISRWRLIGMAKPLWKNGNRSVFFFSYFINLDTKQADNGSFFSQFWNVLPSNLANDGWTVNWLHHYLPSQMTPTTKKGRGWLRLFNQDEKNQGLHAFLDNYLTVNVFFNAMKSWFFLSLAARKVKKLKNRFKIKDSSVDLWPILKEDWYKSTSGSIAASNCLWVSLFDSMLSQIPRQELGLYLNENQSWELAMLVAWKKHGHKKIIGVQHATVPFWHLYYFNDVRAFKRGKDDMPLPDQLAVNGTESFKAFKSSGYPENKLVKVEALRYLDSSQDLPSKILKEGNNVNEDLLNILVLGDLNPKGMDRFLKIIEKVYQNNSLNLLISLKPHPAHQVVLSDYPQLKMDIVTDPLEKILEEYNVVISANSTSAALEAYLAGLRVVIILDGSDFNLSPLRGNSDVPFIVNSEELEGFLQGLEDIRSNNLVKNNFFFQEVNIPRWTKLLKNHDFLV